MLATLDWNFLDGSGDYVGPDSLDHAVADADRSAKFLVDPFKPRRDVDSVSHDGVAQALCDAEGFSTFRVDDQLADGHLLDREITGLFALKNPARIELTSNRLLKKSVAKRFVS